MGIQLNINYLTRPRGRVKSKNTRSFSEPSLLTGWLTNWLCCQPGFQFHEVKAVKIRGENCKRGCTPTFLSPLDEPKQCNRERWMAYLCFNTCEGVYAMQYENKDAEVQTIYS